MSHKRTGSTPAESAKRHKASADASRQDSSLSFLTKKFLEQLQFSPTGVVDLNLVAQLLGVQKRRIYDITNVLEGIGLIEKESKSFVRWKGVELSNALEMKQEMDSLQGEIDEFCRQEIMLDSHIQRMEELLKDLSRQEKQPFVTFSDLQSLEQLKDSTLVAVRAPAGSTLEVPEPDAKSRSKYRVFVQSGSGPIEVFVLNGSNEAVQLHPLTPAESLRKLAATEGVADLYDKEETQETE